MALKTAALLLVRDEDPKISPVTTTLSLLEKARQATLNIHRNKAFDYYLVQVNDGKITGVAAYSRLRYGGMVIPTNSATGIGEAVIVDGVCFMVGTPLSRIKTNIPRVLQLINTLQ